jgi:hypothetical protein
MPKRKLLLAALVLLMGAASAASSKLVHPAGEGTMIVFTSSRS